MSYYGKKFKINGVICGMVLQKGDNRYALLFERENGATLEGLEAIDWTSVTAETLRAGAECLLPEGYAWELESITYDSRYQVFTVTLKVGKQCWGDVTPYQSQVDTLTEAKTALETENAALQEQLAEADALAIELYEAQATAGTETTAAETAVDTETEAAETAETTETAAVEAAAGTDAATEETSEEAEA